MERNVPSPIRQCESQYFLHIYHPTQSQQSALIITLESNIAHISTIWTTKVIISLICVGCLLTLFQAITLTVALTFQKVVALIPFNVVIDGFIVGIILLQLLTIRRSTAVSTAGESNFHKKIVKLSTRIMLLFCFFVTPFIIILNLLRNIDEDKLNENHKSTLQFIFCFSIVFFNGNSLANTIHFLTTNVKAKRFLQTFLKWILLFSKLL